MRILFVCMGNICRSPTAEAVFRRVLEEEGRGLQVHVDSAGTHGYHIGDPPDRRTIEAARRRGVEMGHLRARQVSVEDFHAFDLLVAMDEANVTHLENMAPTVHTARVRLFMDYAPQSGHREVPDPYYGGAAGFEQVLDLVEAASRGLLAELKR